MQIYNVSAAIAIVILSSGVIGYNEELDVPSWCWIDPNAHPSAILWQYLAGKLWEIIAFAIILALYAAIKCTLWKQVRCYVRQ